MTLTINEESESANQNPLDDVFDTTVGPDYLNPVVTISVIATAYRAHTISQTFILTLNFANITFPTINYDIFPFGTFNNATTNKTRVFTPVF